MAMTKPIVIFFIIICALVFVWLTWAISKVEAHHNIYLPLVPNTALMQNLKIDRESTWCVNSAANNYPGFVSGLNTVNNAFAANPGIAHRRVPGTFESSGQALAAGCDVWHNGRYDNFCSGCAANVLYANWPVTINYKLSLGYFSFRSTNGHELGHAELGLHEQYIDLGNIGCTGRTNTVMDCGSGVEAPTSLDVERFCAIADPNGTIWSGCIDELPLVPPWLVCDLNWNGCWHGGIQRWVGNDGRIFNPSNGQWTAPSSTVSWGGYYNSQIDRWVSLGGDIFDWGVGWQLHPLKGR